MAYPGNFAEAQTAIEDLKIGSPAWFELMVDGYLKIRDQYAKPYWDTAFELFENEQFQGFGMNAASTAYGLIEVQPARVFGLVQQIESQVVASRPEFIVDPMKAKTEDLAEFGGAVVNSDWQRTHSMMPETRMATRNCILTGWGPMLSGVETDYAAARRDRKRRFKVAEQIQSDPMLGDIQADIIGQIAQGMDSVDEPRRETNYEMTDLVWKRRVFSRAISPFQYLIDPNCASLPDAEWNGRIIIARLDAVKMNPDFENVKNLKPTAVFNGTPEARAAMSPEMGRWNRLPGYGDQGIARVILYELFVRQPDGTWDKVVLARGHKKPIQVVKDCYDIGNPYRLLRWNHTSKRIFATSDVQAVMTQVIEERELRTRLHDGFMRSAVDNYVGSKQLFSDDTAIHPTTVEGIGNILLLENLAPGMNPDMALRPMARNGQMSESIAYLQILERDFQVASGLGANQQSMALKSETSATEAAEIAKWTNSRGRSKFAFCEEWASGIALDRLGLICQFYDEHDIAALAGPEAAKFWVKEKFTAGDIQAGLSIRVEEGTMQPKDNASKAIQLKDLFTACINPVTAPIANVYINAGETFQELIRTMGVPRGSKIANEVPPEVTQMLSQFLMQMGMAQLAGGAGAAPGGGGGQPQGAAEQAQMSGSTQ